MSLEPTDGCSGCGHRRDTHDEDFGCTGVVRSAEVVRDLGAFRARIDALVDRGELIAALELAETQWLRCECAGFLARTVVDSARHELRRPA